jgi:hypothetical protein
MKGTNSLMTEINKHQAFEIPESLSAAKPRVGRAADVEFFMDAMLNRRRPLPSTAR